MIIISNMDKKPASCLSCRFNHGDCLLQKDSERIETYEEQYRLCPLKEVCTAEEAEEAVAEDELISRKAAVLQLSHNRKQGDEEWAMAVDNDIQTIWNIPPARPEVVKCRSCLYWKDRKHCKELERDTGAGFYCGHGKERRKNK